MRIAFIGKGGSGKTTLSSLVARLAPAEFQEVYVIDSDINMHMKGALKLSGDKVNQFLPVFKHFDRSIRENHPKLSDLKSLPRTLPPWDADSLYEIGFDMPPFNVMAKANERTMVLELGGYSADTIGWSCHHNSLGKLQLVLSHMKDSRDQLIIADLTAGADVFGVGLLGSFDMVFVVVEPTIKSTDIFVQLSELAQLDNVQLIPIANKVIDESDVVFIAEKIGQKPLYEIALSNFVRRLERGEDVTNKDIEPSNYAAALELLKAVKSHRRNEKKMYDSIVKSHERAAQNWPKDKFGALDLLTLINPKYSIHS